MQRQTIETIRTLHTQIILIFVISYEFEFETQNRFQVRLIFSFCNRQTTNYVLHSHTFNNYNQDIHLCWVVVIEKCRVYKLTFHVNTRVQLL